MEERTDILKISRLLSEKEYVELKYLLAKRGVPKSFDTISYAVALGTAVLTALHWLAKGGISIYYIPLWCIALPPLYKALFFLWLLLKKRLDSKFYHSDAFKNEAATITLTPETLEVKTVRTSGRYPLGLLDEILETRHSFIAFAGGAKEVVIPKRLLTEEQIEELRSLFENKLKRVK